MTIDEEQKMAIALKDLLLYMDETQEVTLFVSDFTLKGSCDAMLCMLNEEILRYEVLNIEAEESVLKIWIDAPETETSGEATL